MIPCFRQFKPGNTLSEYALTAGIVAVVCVAGVWQLAKNVDTQLAGFNGSLVGGSGSGGHATEPGKLSPERDNSDGNASGVTRDHVYSSGLGSVSIEELRQAIMVAGANGGTEQMVSIMREYVQQLIEDGEITTSEGDLLLKLANEGHRLAETERNLENAVLEGGSEVSYQGKTYSMQEFSSMLKDDITLSKEAGLLTGPFVDLYEKVKNSDMMQDPVIGPRINILAKRIMVLGYLTKKNLDESLGTSISREDYNQRLSTDASKSFSVIDTEMRAASDMTDDDSEQICKTGGGKDKNKRCKPASLKANDASKHRS